MTSQLAACSCGQLAVECEGEPVRRSICHCLACQRRTGSIFGVQARWPRERTKIEGTSTKYVRVGNSGERIAFHFCPVCGSTVYWTLEARPEVVAVAVGAFADPEFPPPKFSVYEARKHRWFDMPRDTNLEHHLDDNN